MKTQNVNRNTNLVMDISYLYFLKCFGLCRISRLTSIHIVLVEAFWFTLEEISYEHYMTFPCNMLGYLYFIVIVTFKDFLQKKKLTQL